MSDLLVWRCSKCERILKSKGAECEYCLPAKLDDFEARIKKLESYVAYRTRPMTKWQYIKWAFGGPQDDDI